MLDEQTKIKEITSFMIFELKPNAEERKYYEEQQAKYYYYGRVNLLFPNANSHNEFIENEWRHKILCFSLSENAKEYKYLYSKIRASEVYEFLALTKARKYL